MYIPANKWLQKPTPHLELYMINHDNPSEISQIKLHWPYVQPYYRHRMAQVDARMGEIEEKLQAEIEAEELAFREKEEKEKPRGQSRAAVDRWKISLMKSWVKWV